MKNILDGKCFHIFGENRTVEFQGRIVGLVNEHYALVQYFEWIMGEPNDLAVIPIAQMVKNGTEQGSYQFYTDAEQMIDWYNTHEWARPGTRKTDKKAALSEVL